MNVITFNPDGTARCLYTELIDLPSIGSLEVSRASNIEFNNDTQFWEVKNFKEQVLYFNRSRAICLAWEQQHFNR